MVTIRRKLHVVVVCALCAVASAQSAPKTLKVEIEGLLPSGNLPLSTAFCLPQGSKDKPLDKSPGLRWSKGPRGTKSYVVINVDPDVTTNLSLMNKPGVTIAADSPRQSIYHWELINIAPSVRYLPPGAEGDGFVPGGKPIGQAKYGVRGTNDYWMLFNKGPRATEAMKGPYGGFDGPCPPTNDDLVHRYTFQVFALDVATLPLSGQFFTPAVFTAMKGHILAQGEATAKFTFDGK